jgi:hypothetical protein
MLKTSYLAAYSANATKYAAQIAALKRDAHGVVEEYMTDKIHLCIFSDTHGRTRITVTQIIDDLTLACSSGKSFVEYRVHKHYYPGWKGDNVSFFTGKYYLRDPEIKAHLEVPGAPSLVGALRAYLPECTVSFRCLDEYTVFDTSGENINHGFLRIELI